MATATTLPHTVLAKGKGGELDPEDREGSCSCARSVRLLHQHLPAQRFKQRRTSTIQGGLDGGMEAFYPPLP